MSNFKSIPEAQLQLEPLTLLVGPNSSGKSSIIQSILLLVQAAQAEAEGSTFPLNGPLTSLGSYKDVRFRLAKGPTVSIGGNFVFNDYETPQIEGLDYEDYRPLRQFRRALPPQISGAVDVEFAFDRPSVDEPGSADISSVRVDLEVEDDMSTGLKLDAQRRGEGEQHEDIERIRVGKLAFPTSESFALGFVGTLQRDARDGRLNVSLRGLSLQAGIPNNIVAEWDLGTLAAYVWVDSRVHRPIWRGALGPGLREPGEGAESIAPSDRQKLEGWAEMATSDISRWSRIQRDRPIAFVSFLAQQGSVIPPADRALARSHSAYLIEEIGRRTDLPDPVYAPPESHIAATLEEAASEVHRFLSDRVVYLGPLREDPRVTYRSTPVGATGYIGTKGEYAASVLHASRTGDVACPTVDGTLERMRLAEALDYWVSRFDLADAVNTTDLGRLGIQVSVSRGELTDLDLTSVGVGVSQILPVILMCLLAPPGSLILLEQPELHLHPGLQQKLGDFLIACSKAGRQLIVETHSEYLLQRLRRRIAEDPDNELAGHVAVYFAEQSDGVSSIRRVELNALGGIEDWPVGFFDQSADESRRILEAGLGKKLDPVQAADGDRE